MIAYGMTRRIPAVGCPTRPTSNGLAGSLSLGPFAGVLLRRIIPAMTQTHTPTKLLLVADQRRVDSDSGRLRRYRIARLRFGGAPTPGMAAPQRKLT